MCLIYICSDDKSDHNQTENLINSVFIFLGVCSCLVGPSSVLTGAVDEDEVRPNLDHHVGRVQAGQQSREY